MQADPYSPHSGGDPMPDAISEPMGWYSPHSGGDPWMSGKTLKRVMYSPHSGGDPGLKWIKEKIMKVFPA